MAVNTTENFNKGQQELRSLEKQIKKKYIADDKFNISA